MLRTINVQDSTLRLMMSLSEPSLLVDEAKVRRNIERMATKAKTHSLEFRPHFKTHQSKAIGSWFRDYGVHGITVSSLRMARYFADAGWEDITIAFPAIPNHVKQLNELAKQAEITILLSNSETFSSLDGSISEPVHAFIEIDTGSHRTGFLPSQKNELKKLISQLNKSTHIRFKGFYSHPGHSYQCRSQEEIKSVHKQTLKIMQELKQHFNADVKICVGDTPCCSVGERFNGIDQISPGNFVFYDLMQVQIEACSTDDIAVALACPVIARYPQRNKIAVHAGAIHLSKDRLHESDNISFGQVVSVNEDLSWDRPIDSSHVKSLSQEHGIIACSSNFFNRISIGDTIGILPVHSCLTADAMKSYVATGSNLQLDHLQATTP